MSDDWDTVTKIGSKARAPGAAQRETVVRGKGALNAAQRSGAIVATEKKFGAGNTASKPGAEGQHLTKVDRSDDIVVPKKIDSEISKRIMKRRSEEPYKMTQAQLAQKANLQVKDIQDLENPGKETVLNQQKLQKVERVLNMRMKTWTKINDKKP